MIEAAPREARGASGGAATVGTLALGATLATLLLTRRSRVSPPAPGRPCIQDGRQRDHTARLTSVDNDAPQARQLYCAAAMLAASVLSDSAVEHYRGEFANPGTFAPLASAGVLLACALRAATRAGRGAGPASVDGEHRTTEAPMPTSPTARAPVRRTGAALRSASAVAPYATACAVGAAGLGFHTYNVLRRPGGPSWANLFYAAPLGAPAALSLAGLLGLAARRVAGGTPTLLGMPRGRALAALAAGGLAGNSAEAALLHFRGAYHHHAMWIPVSVPPVAALLLARTALTPERPSRRQFRQTRAWLTVTTWLGLAGVGFHARGIARQMGGWRNWSQNVLSGPPLPAPPSFSALALAGRAALLLCMRDAKDATR